jgi:hypothetical protein
MKKNGVQEESTSNFTDQNVNQAGKSTDRYDSNAHVSSNDHRGSSLVDDDKDLNE